MSAPIVSPAAVRTREGDLATATCPVLILNYDGWDDTIAGITAMRDHGLTIWLIDNCSPNDRLDEVKGLFPEIRTIAIEANLGWAGAYNRAIATAAAEGHPFVYILNNDAVLRPDAVLHALTTLQARPDAAVVGSMMLDSGGTRAFFDGDWHWDRSVVAALRDDVREVRSVHGGGFALRLAAFDAVGPFHEAYFLYHEEIDWCLRARAAGWRILVNCRSRADHEGEGSSTGFNRLYYVARNRFLAQRRGIALRDRHETRWSIVEYEILGAAKLGFGARRAIVDGLIDGLRGRFGRRVAGHSILLTAPLAILAPGLFRIRRKLTFLFSGRPRG